MERARQDGSLPRRLLLRSLSSIDSGLLSPLVRRLLSLPTPLTHRRHPTRSTARTMPTGGHSQLRTQLHPARSWRRATTRSTWASRSASGPELSMTRSAYLSLEESGAWAERRAWASASERLLRERKRCSWRISELRAERARVSTPRSSTISGKKQLARAAQRRRRSGTASAPVDDDNRTAHLPQAGLDKERRIDDAQLLAAEPGLDELPGEEAAHGRVDDRVEDLALLVVVEDDAAELLAVQGAVVAQDVGAKVADEGREGVRVWLDGDAGEDVEVDDGDLVVLEELGDGRLA